MCACTTCSVIFVSQRFIVIYISSRFYLSTVFSNSETGKLGCYDTACVAQAIHVIGNIKQLQGAVNGVGEQLRTQK